MVYIKVIKNKYFKNGRILKSCKYYLLLYIDIILKN